MLAILLNSVNASDERASSSAPVRFLALQLALDVLSKDCMLADADAQTLQFGGHKTNHRQSVQFLSSRRDLWTSLACKQA